MHLKLLAQFVRNPHAFRWNVKSYSQSVYPSRVRPSKISYLSVPGRNPLSGLTTGAVVDLAADRFDDSDALISAHQNIRRTFTQIKEEIDSLGGALLKIGLKKGDRLGIWGPNSYEWFLTQMAAYKAGLILVNINPAYQVRELLYCITKVGIKAIIFDEHYKSQNYFELIRKTFWELEMDKVAPGCVKSSIAPSLTHLIEMSKEPQKCSFQFHQLIEEGRTREAKELLATTIKAIKMDDVCNIQFTSGTTGNPKGVMLTHHNINNNARQTGERWSYSQKDKLLIIPPFFHCFGGVFGILNTFHWGAATVIPAKGFDPKKSAEIIAKEKCTIVYGTPTMHIDVINLPDIKKYDLSSLRLAVTAGAICPVALIRQMKQIYTVEAVGSIYGLTENSPAVTQSLPEDDDMIRSTTVGYPLEHLEVKIIDKKGQVVPLGDNGELCTRGYNTMSGYWEDPEKTKEVLDQARWFYTGDLSKMTETGHLVIVGRIKDMIIRGGENIYPKEIEEFLHTHPKISEAQVFGIPDKRLGEVVAVWIRVREGQELSEVELKAFCKGQISDYKIPKYIIFTKVFPTTTSGKIQKFKMREETIIMLGLSSKDLEYQ